MRQQPALHISNIVHGRERDGQRVTYLVDPRGHGTDRDIAEVVVLRRWRARKTDGYRFSGSRMPPSTWRALPIILGDDVSTWPAFTEAEIADRKTQAAGALKPLNLDAPAPTTIVALIAVCGVDRLRALVARHADPARWASPGVPDLFLFAWQLDRRRVLGRFVEVKKPTEPLLRSQVEELAFLQQIGLKARELRLLERGGATGTINEPEDRDA